MKALVLLSLFSLIVVITTENPYGDSHLISIFDGKTLDDWTQAKKGEFEVVNGTIHSMGTARGWIYYKEKVGTFRWIFKVRQVKGNHPPTVLIWGTTEPLRDALSGIQFQPPNGGHYDYRVGKNNGGEDLFKRYEPKPKINVKNWSQCELIANHTTGVAKMACCQLESAQTCKAKEVLEFTDPTAGREGPIAIQIHNKDINDEYEGLFLEAPVVAKPGQFITV